MKEDEIYAMECLVELYGGSYSDGEDPPDAYLKTDSKMIAVEVSRLIQKSFDDKGGAKSRFADDAPAFRLAEEVEKAVKEHIPSELYVSLILRTPLLKVRKTTIQIKDHVLRMLKDDSLKETIEIEANHVDIAIYRDHFPENGKVRIAVDNQRTSSDIHYNTKVLLSDRIADKADKFNCKDGVDEYWLALINEYWIANDKSFQRAIDEMNLSHPFDRILLIDEQKKVTTLDSKTSEDLE